MSPTITFKALLAIGILMLVSIDAKSVEMLVSSTEIIVILNPKTQELDQRFSTQDNSAPPFSCRMPELYVYQETPKQSKYELISTGISIVSIVGKYWDVSNTIKCVGSNCIVSLDNDCGDEGRTIN